MSDVAVREQVLYRMYDVVGDLLYVGITVHVGSRFDHHRHNKPWWSDVATIRLAHFPDRASVEAAEQHAVETESPRYNVRHAPALALPQERCTPTPRRTPQHTFTVDESLWQQCRTVANMRGDKVSTIIRRALVAYVDQFGHLDDGD